MHQAEQEFTAHRFQIWKVQPQWLVLAGFSYLAGLLPCWIFWHRTLCAMGQRPHWSETLRAFWIGHLGKYVPGKAMVVVLRTSLVRSDRVDTTVAATSVFVETLTMMAVGAFVSAAILLAISPNWWLTLLAVGLMIGAGVPTFPPLFRQIVRWLQLHRANPRIDRAIAGVDFRLMGTGWVFISIGWVFLGISLAATLRSMPTVDISFQQLLGQLPLLTASVGLAMVAGFLSLIPGGLGVRDWILMTLLASQFDPGVAVVSAVLLRAVWLLSELVVSAILYMDAYRVRRHASHEPAGAAFDPQDDADDT